MQNLINGAKQIVCILPKGQGALVVNGLCDDYAIYNANFSHARGVGRYTLLKDLGIGEQREKDILTVTVEATIADELFEYIFFKAEMDRPHGGILYMKAVPLSSNMQVPELPYPDVPGPEVPDPTL